MEIESGTGFGDPGALKGWKTQGEIAKMFGVGRQNIGAIMTGRSWPDL